MNEELEGCRHESTEPHECPYRSEIDGDFSLCTCCEDCEQNCMDDI